MWSLESIRQSMFMRSVMPRWKCLVRGENTLASKAPDTQLRVIGGEARNATDKVFQDNSPGGKPTIIIGYFADTSRAFYQSCGNCLNQAKRNVTAQDLIAVNGNCMAIINPGFNDEFCIKDLQISKVKYICDKGIRNNVQTVPYWNSTGTDAKYYLYNEATDNLTPLNSTANTVYLPENNA